MFKKRSRDDQSNFWISYADLMAGLLFVFILLIGAIVSKSIIMREDLYEKEAKLGETEVSLMEKIEKLNQTEKSLKALTSRLDSRERMLRDINNSLFNSKKKLSQQKEVLAQKNQNITQKKQVIAEQEEKIKLQVAEVKKLHQLLAELQSSLKESSAEGERLNESLKASNTLLEGERSLNAQRGKELKDLQAVITLTKDSLKLKESELEKLNQLLLARNSKVDTLNKKIVLLQNLSVESNMTLQQKQKKLQEYVGKVIVLSSSLTEKKHEMKLKDEKLATLLEALDKKRTKYDELVAKLQNQRAQIKSLTGIKLKVISALKETLGSRIDIDRSSGALRLASNILFDKGSSALKGEAQAELRSAFEDYIGALVSNEAIRPHLDRIVIEGHTDSDGTYLYNLQLSQERALAVMNYLLTLPIAQKYQLKKYLVASGRAYLDNITHGGVEDKDASRRIEIKFQLKNQDAMHEIERILGDEKQLF